MNRDRIRRAGLRVAAGVALLASLGLAEAFAQPGRAQTNPPPPQPAGRARSSTMRVELPMPPVAETPVPLVDGGRDGRLNTLSFTTPDANFERNVVKGSPFTAESVTEHVQRLGDGNRMVRKSSAKLFRDSAGRTRREHALTRGNVSASDGQEPRLIIINDPVGQVEYLLDTARGTLRKTRMSPALAEARRQMSGTESSFGVLMPTSAAHRRMAEGDAAAPMPEPKKERLETQQIEGVLAEGTRITVTIPAGEFDNEQPLEIVHEQWYSPELQMVVLLKHNDPRFGETTFRLTNITRGDPSPDLFAEPQGYRTVDQHEPVFGRPVMRRQ
ncbi:MAG: hypothetical protein QOH49_864 [Acidobacteriota bacterium]|nr:hypothetical protein [Acidobacteriota bacterium]